MRTTVLVITLLSSMAVYPLCSCTELNSLDIKEYSGYDLIFQGLVTSIEEEDNHHLKTITLKIKEVYKGEVTEKSVEIGTNKRLSTCGLNIGLYDEWLIYAYEKDGIFQTNICTRSTPLPPRDFRGYRLEEDLKFLKEIQKAQLSELDFLNSNRGHFQNIVPGKHEEYDTYGYVDSLHVGIIRDKMAPGIKLFSTVFSSEENLEYVEIQELLLEDIVEVRQKGNHLDLISVSEPGAKHSQGEVRLCMDYNNDENLQKIISRIEEMCYKNKSKN